MNAYLSYKLKAINVEALAKLMGMRDNRNDYIHTYTLFIYIPAYVYAYLHKYIHGPRICGIGHLTN